MKRLLTAALALSLLGGSVATAQPYGGHPDDHRGPPHDQQGPHQWARGQRLPATYYHDRGRYIDYRAHHLRRPPHGYQWVQADNNYALVALTTGLISQIVASNH